MHDSIDQRSGLVANSGATFTEINVLMNPGSDVFCIHPGELNNAFAIALLTKVLSSLPVAVVIE